MHDVNLREARLVVVDRHASGETRLSVGDRVKKLLADAFGGYTHFYSKGADPTCQHGPEEYSQTFDVAVNAADRDNWRELLNIAHYVRTALTQESVYLRWPDGSVSLIEEGDGLPSWAPDPYGLRSPTGNPYERFRREHDKRVEARQKANSPW